MAIEASELAQRNALTHLSRTAHKTRVLLGTAVNFGTLSTCSRMAVGCVLAIDHRIIATGYNGAPAGLPHCDHNCRCTPTEVMPRDSQVAQQVHERHCPTVNPCQTAIHAEANAIADAARRGVALRGADLFVTMAPCLPCAQLIVSVGIRNVYYLNPYRDDAGLRLIYSAGIACWRESIP